MIGGGVIGMSLAIELRRHGAEVLVMDRSQPGREASHAAAGMLARCDQHLNAALRPLAEASVNLYPGFVEGLEAEAGLKIDFRRDGTILLPAADEGSGCSPVVELSPERLAAIEPALAVRERAWLLDEQTVDPRELIAALIKATKHRGVHVASGAGVVALLTEAGRTVGVKTAKAEYAAPAVVNCAGAWAGDIAPRNFPPRPVKGQMLAVAAHGVLRHVIRAADVYLVPRSSGRVLIGSTLEDAGFDKRVDAGTLHGLHQAAANLVPAIGEARILEYWAGLRPGTPDGLPLLGPADIEGYFVAAGHYRDGIMLAPVTAVIMADIIRGRAPEFDIAPFSPARFS